MKKNKPYFVLLINGLDNNKPLVFQQEINSAYSNLLKSLKNLVFAVNEVEISIDSKYEASISDVSFYDVITLSLKTHSSKIKTCRTVINIIHNTDDVIDSENKEFILKFISEMNPKKCKINFFTNRAENQHKALDFGIVAELYSKTSVGIQALCSKMVTKTSNFLRGKNL